MSLERSKNLNTGENKEKEGHKRWYDDSFVNDIINSFEKAPLFKRAHLAEKFIEIVDATLKHDKHYKINTNKYMILGRYKEYNKRRWYDKDPITQKAVHKILSMVGQNDEIQKKAREGMISSLGEYYIKKKPKVKVRQSIQNKPEEKKEEPKTEILLEDEVARKKLNHNVMVSGEKLFIKKDKKKLNPKKNRPQL